MKIVEHAHSVNFIDENDVFIGFDTERNCCENFGWYISYSKERVEKEFGSIDVETIEGYTFDVDSLKTYDELDYGDIKSSIVIKLTKKKCKHIYLHLYNEHNGYYAHGFTLREGNRLVYDIDI